MKANQTIKATINKEASTITFTVKDAGEVVLDLGKVHADNLAYAALHGFKQRLADAAAMSCDTATGRSATPQEKYEAIKRLADHYMAGGAEWNVAREGGVGGGRVSYLAEALAQVKGLDVGAVREWLKERTAAEKAALENVPEVKAIIDARRAKGSESVDAGALIAGLMTRKPTSL